MFLKSCLFNHLNKCIFFQCLDPLKPTSSPLSRFVWTANAGHVPLSWSGSGLPQLVISRAALCNLYPCCIILYLLYFLALYFPSILLHSAVLLATVFLANLCIKMSEIAEHIFSITENKCLKDVPRPSRRSRTPATASSATAAMAAIAAVLDRKKSLLTDELQWIQSEFIWIQSVHTKKARLSGQAEESLSSGDGAQGLLGEV